MLSEIPLQNLYNLLEPITVPRNSPGARFTNWGLSYTCLPAAIFEPENEFQCELVLELAKREGKTVRAVGVGHSPSDLACTKEYMIRMTKLNRVLEVNSEKRYIVAQGGITLDDLHAHLAKNNLAMSSVGSISEQTLAGVVATATHGSGINFCSMSSTAMALTLLLADGTRLTCSRSEHGDVFLATLCGLGTTGIILSAQLEVEPAFRLREVQRTLPFEEITDNLDDHVNRAEHVRFWWFPTKDRIRASYSNRTAEPKSPAGSWWWHTFLGHHVVQILLFIARYISNLNSWVANFACWLVSAETVGIDDSLKIFNVDCRYPQYTTEWAIPYENTRACLLEFREYLHKEYANPHGLRPHFPVEIRFTAEDDIWLSPSFGRKTCWIGIVQYKPFGLTVPYRKLFSAFERIVQRHSGRPHWAKAHPFTPAKLREVYPHFNDFQRVMKTVDPRGVWRNEYVERHLVGVDVADAEVGWENGVGMGGMKTEKHIGWRVHKARQ
ncbi:gulonolactone oxidase Lgo1 [Crepidotus variabilis]|uniref:D-arabinono-1,4-lactone oxidase n=1 Tax=Crepidotus variabilis TaxID=179855 RepID=A0A9P6JQ06_9AGAR|nr:gulonolactone oxidase Lgo1 [Crepidotus variabilis]